MNLNQITVPSLDVKKSIEFYKILGLHLIVHTHDAYARFECPNGDSTFSIHLVDKLPNKDGVIVYFECDKLETKVEELKKKGLHFEKEIQEQSWLWKEAYLRDPDNNLIILYFAGDNRKNPPWRLK